jgi:hypothetical protein
MEIRYNFIQNKIQKGVVKLQYIPTNQAVVFILTKPLAKGKFEVFKDRLQLVHNSGHRLSCVMYSQLVSASELSAISVASC